MSFTPHNTFVLIILSLWVGEGLFFSKLIFVCVHMYVYTHRICRMRLWLVDHTLDESLVSHLDISKYIYHFQRAFRHNWCCLSGVSFSEHPTCCNPRLALTFRPTSHCPSACVPFTTVFRFSVIWEHLLFKVLQNHQGTTVPLYVFKVPI